jgi:hypothetical protein
MRNSNSIKHLRREDIDPARWNACINGASNSLIYAGSIYLDHLATHWDALVEGDYRCVMPLTWNSKWGIRYLHQPPFTQQLGVFSAAGLSPESTGQFLAEAGKRFRFAEIALNYGNPYPGCNSRSNYILSLNLSYSELASGYKKDLVKNLQKAGHHALNYVRQFDLAQALALYRLTYQSRLEQIAGSDFDGFEKLCFALQEQGAVIVRASRDSQGNPIATALLLRHSKRIYLLQSTTPIEGRRLEANHFLIDQVIREFAGQDLILDFEGSQNPGIAHFYANFGAVNQPYWFYRRNRLPWPIRLLKKRD